VTELKPSEIERIKLSANFANAIASGVVLTSTIVPFVGLALGTVQAANAWIVAGLVLLGLVVAAALHYVARRIVRGLDR
jgi:predicted Na+-dependent transporter